MKYILVIILWSNMGITMVFDNKPDCESVKESIQDRSYFTECIQVTTL